MSDYIKNLLSLRRLLNQLDTCQNSVRLVKKKELTEFGNYMGVTEEIY